MLLAREPLRIALLVEPLRIALLLAREWQKPIVAACTDASSASESIDHQLLVSGWAALGAPSLLIAAFFRDMAEVTVDVLSCGQLADGAEAAMLSGGGGPVDVATPTHWNVMLFYILQPLVMSWASRGYGFRMGDAVLLVLIWADDFMLIASSIEEMRITLSELASLMHGNVIDLEASKRAIGLQMHAHGSQFPQQFSEYCS